MEHINTSEVAQQSLGLRKCAALVAIVGAIGIPLSASSSHGVAQITSCASGFQYYANHCISEEMGNYIACIETHGGNKKIIKEAITTQYKIDAFSAEKDLEAILEQTTPETAIKTCERLLPKLPHHTLLSFQASEAQSNHFETLGLVGNFSSSIFDHFKNNHSNKAKKPSPEAIITHTETVGANKNISDRIDDALVISLPENTQQQEQKPKSLDVVSISKEAHMGAATMAVPTQNESPLPTANHKKHAKKSCTQCNVAKKSKAIKKSSTPLAPTLDEYKVDLGADRLVKMPGTPGELRLWIGIPANHADFPSNMVTASGTLPAVGETAMVAPFSLGFEFEPKDSICMRIDPSGSEVRFKLKPIKEGTFDVSADVQLFHSADCSGAPIPKATTSLKIKVVADPMVAIQEHTKEFSAVFWSKLLDFWGGILALIFAVLGFLIKDRLKKWFGFKGNVT